MLLNKDLKPDGNSVNKKSLDEAKLNKDFKPEGNSVNKKILCDLRIDNWNPEGCSVNIG